MRLSTLRLTTTRTAAARVDRNRLTLLPFPDIGTLLTDETWQEHATEPGEPLTHTSTVTGPLITRLATFAQVEVNYATRARELNSPPPSIPRLLTTPVVALAGDRDVLRLTDAPDLRWGVELGVMIGQYTSRVPRTRALSSVAGYTVVNTFAAPGWPATVAIGPQLVTADELPIGARGLTLTATLDGRLRQKANTSDLLFDVATLIEHASARTALMPGDLISTGTPAAISTQRLHDGSSITVAVKGIGELHNTVAERSSPGPSTFGPSQAAARDSIEG
ncbi:fumarylacetoacetate hydrolase family protein [Streptomyces rhizosphaericola]|uniref:2-hydroxyhepta-2,4-diene-1,7-dioate isomerase n=1 Tax=Streptomyces rhizosphaericola TaxID=2564098 RepID=A0ABY2PM49_9ACTN|nr:fumarylacetoacetate hydrolase family protein [Streptomyces rhizosphaericola]TGZ11967.1 2-hydroxyhepta-2,4-diene-1,7-dioate isomerase [Streptomyces rhizosphaericola]